jgi:hypothetical protein
MRNTIILAIAALFMLPQITNAQSAKREYVGHALDGVNFADYTTYSWLPFIDSVMVKDFDSEQLDQLITEAVNAEMANRGFTEVEEGADLVLQYMLVVEQTKGTKSVPVLGRPNVSMGFGFGSHGSSVGVGVSGPRVTGYEQVNIMYKEGALILGMLATEMETTVWRGSVSSIREDKGELVNPQKVIAEVVPRIFKEFPKVKRKKK